MPESRARKILRRTLSGGALLATVAGLLVWNARSGDGRPLYWSVAVVLVAAVIEVSRMGSLALVGLRPALLLAAVSALLFANAAIEGSALRAEYARLGVAPAASHAPEYALELAFAVLVALAVHGLTRALARLRAGAASARLIALAAVGLIILWALHDVAEVRANVGPALALLGLVALATAPIAGLEPGGWKRLAILAGLAAWIVPPLPALWGAWSAWGTGGLIALLALSKVGDTAGYYVGSAIGRTHPFPRISPGKTTAGCVASLVTATALGGILSATGVMPEGRFGAAGGLLCGALVNVAAQAGDLLESWVKRRAGVKDSSGIFGPSGGLLDQVDSLLVSVPVALATWPWILEA